MNVREVLASLNEMEAAGVESYRKIAESKRVVRRELASRPVGEKLRILDSLRERHLAIQKGRELRSSQKNVVKPAR